LERDFHPQVIEHARHTLLHSAPLALNNEPLIFQDRHPNSSLRYYKGATGWPMFPSAAMRLWRSRPPTAGRTREALGNPGEL